MDLPFSLNLQKNKTTQPLYLLLINQYFPPDTSATARVTYQIVETLAERHQVIVLAGRPSYNPTETHPYYLWRREVAGQVTVERIGSTGYYRGRMRFRLLNYFTYLVLALPRALTINADVVISMTDPPLAGLIGALAARFKKCTFVYYIQDLHPDMALVSGMVRPAGWVTIWEKLHRWVLHQANHIVVLGEDMKALVAAKGVDPARIEVVRGGAEIPSELPPPDNPISQEIRGGLDFVLMHAGNLGFYGAWETLIKAANLISDPTIGLIFIGEGAAKARLKQLANGNPQVRFLPFRPVTEIPYVLASADLHVVTIRAGAEGVIVPSKLFPILAAGRPVLAVTPATSDVARIVTKANCGVIVAPDDPAAVAEAVLNCAQNPERLAEMEQNARVAASEYEIGAQLNLFRHIIEKVGFGNL